MKTNPELLKELRSGAKEWDVIANAANEAGEFNAESKARMKRDVYLRNQLLLALQDCIKYQDEIKRLKEELNFQEVTRNEDLEAEASGIERDENHAKEAA